MTLLSLIIFVVAVGTVSQFKEVPKPYPVKKIKGPITLSGKGDDARWKVAELLSDFHYPWETDKPLPTKFRALHNDEWVYCLFDVEDQNVNILQKTDDKSEVVNSSRAEIFFRIDDKLNPYYCLEIDPLGRVFDYEARYYRKFDAGWSWPKGHLMVKTARRKNGYSIELAISKESLKKLGLLKNEALQAGLFRAECFPKEKGEPDFKWISWIKPDSESPDFHIPSSFGTLRLEE